SIFDLLIPFAGYGFNKSHAAAYSVLAYQIIYLKAHFPVEFMAAKLSNEINSPDKLVLYIDEARRMGLPIEPPDINKSDKYFTVVDGKIVYGLLGIKGVGEWPSRAIIAGRQTSPYKDFLDFLLHIDLRVTGKKVIELLISTGACDSFGVKRSVLLGNLLRAAEYTQKIKDDKKSAQTSLFADSGEAEYSSFEFFDFPEYSQNEKLKTEKELLGFYFSGHPMDEYKSLWEKYSQIDLRNTENIIRGRDYYVCGIIKSVRSMQIKNGSNAGKQMGSAVLYDYNGEIELTFFTERWEKYKNIIEVDSVFVIKGRFDVRNDKPALSAWEAYSVHDLDNIDSTKIIEEPQNNSLLEPYKEVWKRAVTIDLSNTEQAENGKEYLLVGIITTLKPYQITKGRNKDKWMCFASLSDYKGTIDVIIFNDKWDIVKDKLAVDTVAAIRGTVGERENKKGIILSEVLDPAKLETLCWKELHIRLKTENVKKEEDIIPIRDCIIEHSGTCHVFIHVPVNNKEVIVRTTTHIAAEATHKHIDELKHFSPVAEVWRV
ncbi:MAG: DNA polymerase III subunit alpha, partial [Spirochaetaceae bacterium]|nr:DNA polymerase III subunit alpha [Spirochaetaceae bacterium]